MSIKPVAIRAYQDLAKAGQKVGANNSGAAPVQEGKEFTTVLKDSLSKVNSMQQDKSSMIEAFATGQNQNVHELMITLQKAGVAMSLTSAVRNKVMEAYKELMRMPF